MARIVSPSNWADVLQGLSLKQKNVAPSTRSTIRRSGAASRQVKPTGKAGGWGTTNRGKNVTKSALAPQWSNGQATARSTAMSPQQMTNDSTWSSAPQVDTGSNNSFRADNLSAILSRGGGVLKNAGDANTGPVPASMGNTASIPGVAGNAVKLAMAQLGDPYVWGAGRELGNSNPGSFDCSGLTYWAYGRAGIKLPSTANAQWQSVRKVGKDVGSFKPGDLVFFNFGRLGAGAADHVGIYMGNGQFVHAPNKRSSVKVSPLSGSYASHLLGAGRPA